MYFLIAVVTFFTSVDREPFSAVILAPSLAACEAKATEQTHIAEKDPEVSGYAFQCLKVPTKV